MNKPENFIPEFLYLDKGGLLTSPNRFDVTDIEYKRFPFKMHKFPTSFQATDSVIIHREAGKLLLGRKRNQPAWRFIGGFVDPNDDSLESSSVREKNEEAGIGLECSKPEYLFSFRVNDPRYPSTSPDRIMSAVFISYYLFGVPKAGDDIHKVQWFTKDYIRRNYKKLIMPEHAPIVEQLIAKGYL